MSLNTSITVNCDGDSLPGGRAEGTGENLGFTPNTPPDQVTDLDGCHWWIEHGSAHTAKMAREHAKGYGWKRKRVDGEWLDLCPACARSA